MPEVNITEVCLTSFTNLRKIIAGRGAIQGNFYFAGDSRGKNAGIVITISTRDPNGSQALTFGRPLRRAIAGSKFAKGIVHVPGNRVWFEIVTGSASDAIMAKAFKNAFADRELARFKAILKKARFGEPPRDESLNQDRQAKELAEEAIASLSEEEQNEVQDLISKKGEIAAVNAQLKATFLDAAAAEAEEREDRQAVLTEIKNLAIANPGDPRLAELRYALAEMIYKAPNEYDDEFPDVGQPLSAPMVQILQAQLGNGITDLLTQLQRLSDAITKVKDEALSKSGSAQQDYLNTTFPSIESHPTHLQKILDQIHNMTR